MKIVIDKSIPFTEGIFEPFAEVLYKDGPMICREDLLDADAMLIRTRTRCDAALLEGTKVKIISTATSGTENIDVAYCQNKGIYFKNASGCNAGGVRNYVFSAIYGSAAKKSIPLGGLTLGIIGLGSTGQRVDSMGRALGFKILRCDPHKAAIEWYTQFCELDELLANSDIVTLHIPLNDENRGLADQAFFSKMKPGAFFVNTSQGDIVNEEALIEAIPRLGPVIIDAWSHEPTINTRLMNMVDIATPHIAGYSLQGKQIGSAMAVRAIARFLSIKELYDYFPTTDNMEYQAVKIDVLDKTQGQVAAIMQYNYPLFTDDFMFRMNPTKFEQLRSNYQYRREFFL